MKKHIISFFDKDNSIVQQELKSKEPLQSYYFKENIQDIDDDINKAFIIKDLVNDIILKPGQEVIILADGNFIMETIVCITIIQRRLKETVKVTIKNDSGSQFIPSVLDLVKKDYKQENMVDYNYCNCSSNCNSCG
jgi:hypothetical protein